MALDHLKKINFINLLCSGKPQQNSLREFSRKYVGIPFIPIMFNFSSLWKNSIDCAFTPFTLETNSYL